MASDKLMNHTQGETIITKLTSIANSLDDLAAVTPAKLGMGIATCDTAASTAAKTAALANFALVEGAPVSVKFTYANTATNATLNINNTGAKPIIYKDAAIGNDVISAGDTCTFIYTTNTYKITNIDTLTGPGSGTVRQVGADNGLITDQTDNADIQTTGNIGLNLKSTTAFSTEVGAHNTSTDNMYPVALDSEGHPVAAVPTMSASGSGHKGGLVPDPGSTAGTKKYLAENGEWKAPDSEFESTPTDNTIPSSKLVKDSLDTKVTSIKAPVSGTSTKVDKDNEVTFQQASGQNPAVTVTGNATNGTVTIEHQTGSGFNHLPKSGADGKYLKWKTGDDGEWVAPDSTWPANPDNKTIPGTKLVDDRFDTDEANILYNLNNGVKNELDNFGTASYKSAGVTFTFNEDGSVRIKGTATGANAAFYYYTGAYSYISNIYKGHILSGVTGGAEGTYGLLAQYSSNGTSWATQEMCKTTPITIKNDYNYINICIIVFSGQSVDTTIYPMLCTPEAWAQSTDYQPPAKSNSELTKEVNILRTSMDNLYRTPVFGFRINKNESNSSTAVEYLYDAVGMTPAAMDFTNSTFNYGSWSDAWFVKNNKPVALNFDGTEAFELDPTNWWKKSDGTTDSGIEDSSTTYNFMSRFPLVYINRWEDENYNYVAISERPVTPNFLAQAHTGLNGTINSNIYLPMFKGWIDGSTGGTISSTGKLRSLAGKWPSCGTDATEEFNAIKNITGSATSGWQLFAHSQYCLLNDLLTLISKSIDVKACFGRGDISTYSASDSTVRDGSKTGYTNNGKYISGYEGYAAGTTTKSTCGQFFGYDDTTHHVTAFFVQDPWGNRWDRSPGLNRINRAYKVKMTPPYSINSDSSYITAGIQTPSSEGWLRKISSSNAYGHLPFAVGDGAADTKNKYFWSYFYTNANTDEKLSLVGGGCVDGGQCSSRCVPLHLASSYRAWSFGGSPCYVSP